MLAFGWRLALRAVAVAFLVLLVVALGVLALVATGPTEIGLVRDQVVQALRSGLGEKYEVSAGRSVIDYDPLIGGLIIRVDDIVVADGYQNVVARVPSTRFSVNARALLTFRLEINAVELSDAEVHFVRLADGTVKLGNLSTKFETANAAPVSESYITGPDGGFPDLIAPLQILDRGIEPPIYAAINAGFQRLGLANATVVVWDELGGRQRRFTNSDLDITVDADTSSLAVEFATMGYGGRWTATLDRTLNANGGGHAMTAVFSQLTLADLFPGLAGNGPVSADIPLYGRASIGFDQQGGIETASARLDFGAGVISFADGDEQVLLDEATVRLRWDIPNKVLIFDRSSFFFGETRGSIAGQIRALGDRHNRTYEYSFVSPGAVLAPRDTGLPPLIARQIAFSGTADPRGRLLNIDNASIITAEGSFSAVGSLGFEGETPSLALAASLSPMSIDTLKQMWVPLISHGARRWAIENIDEGRIVEATFEASVPGGVLWSSKRTFLQPDEMRLNMKLEDLTIKMLGDVPPITGASGNLVLSGSTFGMDIDSGVIEMPSGTVTVEAGAFAVPDTSIKPNSGVIEMQISGSAEALGEIAESKPMQALSPSKVAPSDLSGAGSATISVRLPLEGELTPADIDWKVIVNTRGVTSQVPIDGRMVSDADVAISVTPGETTVYGGAKIDGVEADVSMVLPTLGSRDQDAAPGARLVRLILDDEARRKLGIGLENMLSGSMTALISENEGGGQHYELDMERVRLTIPGVGWTKGVGVPAQMSFDIVEVEDGHDIRNIVFRGDGFGFQGTAKLDPEFGLAKADIAHMALRDGDSVAVLITRGSRGYAVNVRGEALNLQGLISQVRDRYDKSGGFPDLALDAEIDQLIGFNQETIDRALVKLVSVGGETQKLMFAGSLGGTGISLDYAITPDGTTLTGGVEDTGRLMRFADLYTRMIGGVTRLRGTGGATGPMVGKFEIVDFQVVNEPAMERMVVDGSNSSGSAGAAFNPVTVGFQRLTARFTRSDRAITIEDALLRGPDVGATFAGRYDVPSTNIVLTGTYLPAYAVNNLFGQIPILGLALGGGRGGRGGLIGVTFKIAGPIGNPEIYFNPLSAVAPGIFRKIFEFQ